MAGPAQTAPRPIPLAGTCCAAVPERNSPGRCLPSPAPMALQNSEASRAAVIRQDRYAISPGQIAAIRSVKAKASIVGIMRQQLAAAARSPIFWILFRILRRQYKSGPNTLIAKR